MQAVTSRMSKDEEEAVRRMGGGVSNGRSGRAVPTVPRRGLGRAGRAAAGRVPRRGRGAPHSVYCQKEGRSWGNREEGELSRGSRCYSVAWDRFL